MSVLGEVEAAGRGDNKWRFEMPALQPLCCGMQGSQCFPRI